MSRLRMTDTEVYVQMHWLERLGAFYWRAAPRAPRDAITAVHVVTPTQSRVETLIRVPLALNFGTPGRLNTTVPKGATWEGQPAFLTTRRFTPALVVDFDPQRAPWARWVVSEPDAQALAQALGKR